MNDDDFKVNDKRGTPQSKTDGDDSKSQEPLEHDDQADISFANLVLSLGTSAMMHMGVIDNPQTNQKEKNLEMAKQEIDIISMLEEKTKGNLSDAEKKVLEQVLYELRLRFVEASK